MHTTSLISTPPPTASGRTHWRVATYHRAPNKPLLLLTVLDRFAQGPHQG